MAIYKMKDIENIYTEKLKWYFKNGFRIYTKALKILEKSKQTYQEIILTDEQSLIRISLIKGENIKNENYWFDIETVKIIEEKLFLCDDKGYYDYKLELIQEELYYKYYGFDDMYRMGFTDNLKYAFEEIRKLKKETI